jgi:hypothetical protein
MMNPESEEAAEHQSGALQRKQQLASLPAAGRLGTGLQRPNSDLPRTRFTKVARIEAPHESDGHFVSHGSKIFATQPGRRRKPAVPTFDTRTLGLPECPWPSCHRNYCFALFASSALASSSCSFLGDLAAYLGDPPPPGSRSPFSGRPRQPWSRHPRSMPAKSLATPCTRTDAPFLCLPAAS